MKKTLVALAALASVSAFAQSSVAITGRLDLGMSSVKNSHIINNNPASMSVTDLTGNQSGRTTSRLTVAGTEDLGGGLRANFNIETGLNPSDDSGLFAGSTRTGFIQLAGGFGAVTLGTFLNSHDAVRGFSASTYTVPGGDFASKTADLSYFKPVLNAAVSGSIPTTAAALTTAENNAAGFLNSNYGFFSGGAATDGAAYKLLTSGISGRSRNAIAYSSPDMGGLTFSAGLHNQKNATVVGMKTNGASVSVAYANGPLSTRLAIANAKASFVAGGTIVKQSDIAFAVNYNLGMAVPYFLLERTKASDIGTSAAPGTSGTSVASNGWEIGSKFPMGALTPYISMSRGKVKLNGESAGKVSAFQFGTTYDLSKRTYVYVAYGSDNAKSELAGFAPNSLKRTGYSAGLVHSF